MTDVVSRSSSAPEPADATDAPSPLLTSEDPTVVADPPRRRRSLLLLGEPGTVVGQGLTIFGVLMVVYLVYLVGISGMEHGREQRSLEARFDTDLEERTAPVGGDIAEGAPVARLQIPSIGVDEVVVEGTSGTVLIKGPGHLRTSPLPGQRGNSVVAGRRTSYGGPLQDIDDLDRGDTISVTTGQGQATYEVVAIRTLAPGQTDVLENLGDNRLTLVTSTPRLLANRRLVASALLRSAPEPAPAGMPTALRAEELALHSDGSSGVTLLLWAQALLAASLGAAWSWRRWARWPTLVLAAPVLALLLLLVFDSFTPLLPSTL